MVCSPGVWITEFPVGCGRLPIADVISGGGELKLLEVCQERQAVQAVQAV
jgi:hypothetical protein